MQSVHTIGKRVAKVKGYPSKASVHVAPETNKHEYSYRQQATPHVGLVRRPLLGTASPGTGGTGQ